MTIVHNKGVVDPETGATLRDAHGRVGRPDYHVIDNVSGNVVEIAEQGTGSQRNLMRKIEQIQRYRQIAAQLEVRPIVRLEYEVTPNPLFRIGSKILLPLMILDFLINAPDLIPNERAPTQWT